MIETLRKKLCKYEEEKDEEIEIRLSRSDVRDIRRGVFVASMATVAICTTATAFFNIKASKQNAEDMEQIMSTIAAYMTTATEDEYDDIAATIRHDLVFKVYSEDIGKLLQYIPNTAEDCPTCREEYPAEACLLSVNTGEFYPLDLSEEGEDPEIIANGTRLTYGFDEISEAGIHIMNHGGKCGMATICRGRRLVSVHRMKSVFCDDCISGILDAIDGQLVDEVVLFDATNRTFHPVADASMIQIGGYDLATHYSDGDYIIDITPTT